MHKRPSRFTDRLVGVIALATIVLAYIIGLARVKYEATYDFQQLLPSAQRFEKISDIVFVAKISLSSYLDKVPLIDFQDEL